jgi:ABC-type glycerol-3-phosphate transport system substrate-binding protein
MPAAMQRGTSIARRAALTSLAAAGAAAMLWPYTPKDRAMVPRGRTELTYWEKWTGLEASAMQAVVDRFNQSQDRSWVHLVPVSDITSKAMVAIGGDDPPDLVGLFTYSIPGYAEARALMPLEQFSHLGGIDAARYAPGVRDLLFHEGRQWAGVNTCYALALYTNRGMLHAAGLDPDRPPRTIAELDGMNARLTRLDERGLIERAGFLQTLPGWWPYFWPVMFGGRLYDAATDTATCAEARCIASLEWCRGTAARIGVGAVRGFTAGFSRAMHSASDPFISGAMAMIVQGPWLANFIRALHPGLDYTCSPVPVSDELFDPERPTGLLEADILAIPRGCPHPEEAYRFLLFTQRQDMQEQLAIAHCKPSPFLNLSPGFLEGHPNRGIRVFDAVAKSPSVQILPRTRAWKQYADLFGNALDAATAGGDPAALLSDVQTRAQRLIDTLATRRKQRARTA